MSEPRVIEEPRELAVQALYQADQLHQPPDRATAGLTGKALRLAGGVLAEIEDLDEAIERCADRWRVDRMPVVDRAILRLGLWELRHETDTPTAVILAEAVRIAKEFSTENSGRFVNGVLGNLAKQERQD